MQDVLEKSEVLVPEITMPDIGQELQEVETIACLDLAVDSESTHDMAVSIIKKADDYIKRVDDKFSSIKEPLNSAVKSLNSLIKELKEPAEITKSNLRKRCLEWRVAEEKRLKEERDRLIEEARKAKAEWTPLDDTPEPEMPVFTKTVSKSGAGTRKSPFKARITNLDELWAAAVKDPRYREYFIPDQKALDAKARSMGAMMSIPGVEAYQEQNLVIR
jgi:hypothetical protein